MNLEQINTRLDWMHHWLGNTIHAKINNAFGGNMRQLSCDEFLHCKGYYELVIDNTGFIPPMTNPLGKYWEQPHHNQIIFRGGFAIMNDHSFEKLYEYSTSIPSGAYEGKMWKRKQNHEWFLCWYGKHENPELVSIGHVPIKIVNPNFLYMFDEKRTLVIKEQVEDWEYWVNLQKKQQDDLIKRNRSK